MSPSPEQTAELRAPRWPGIALALGVVLSLVGGLHFYLWARLVRDPGLSGGAYALATLSLVVAALSVPSTFALSRSARAGLGRRVLLLCYGWMGVFFFLLVLTALSDLGRSVLAALAGVLGHAELQHALRSPTLPRDVALGVGGLGAVATLAALRGGLGEVGVRSVEVALERLPAALDGTTVVQLSDVHIGPTLGRAFLQRIVAQVNALAPDVVVITGDLVDGPVASFGAALAPLAALRPRHGVYFVTGNHEYYSGARAWCARLTELGVRVLRNERVSIGDGDASFDLAGIDDYHAHRFGKGHGADLPGALAGRDPSRELVLLAHQPRAVFEASQLGVGLQLSGHTHGGQLWPWSYLVLLQQPVIAGLSRFGATQLYVSRGTGYWGPPMRFGAPAEITRLVLRAQRA